MIRCHIGHLAERCAERGYTLAEVDACISARDGEWITVDETHAAYPAKQKPGYASPKRTVAVSGGPGTELKGLLKKIGITASSTCKCNARAKRMDEEEAKQPGWCASHIDEIVGWLREEAASRKLPFIESAGRFLVKLAIKRAGKKNERKGVVG